MAHPGVSQDTVLVRGLYYLQFGFGGPGYTVPFGLLLGGVSITASFGKLLPKWIIVRGPLLAITAELSWMKLVIPKPITLIPLTRFVGFIWLIAAGFCLPKSNRFR